MTFTPFVALILIALILTVISFLAEYARLLQVAVLLIAIALLIR